MKSPQGMAIPLLDVSGRDGGVSGRSARRRASRSRAHACSPLACSRAQAVLKQPSLARHFSALFTKRFRYARRDRRALIFQLLIPIVALVLGLSVLQIPTAELPPLAITFQAQGYPSPQPLT
jgi:hypothetical protein